MNVSGERNYDTLQTFTSVYIFKIKIRYHIYEIYVDAKNIDVLAELQFTDNSLLAFDIEFNDIACGIFMLCFAVYTVLCVRCF